ncbi:MAG: hypothetical protein QOI77_2948 [Blastocatellia bacterium]|nr:hypothetical protein [Blastocatellia bacterium]
MDNAANTFNRLDEVIGYRASREGGARKFSLMRVGVAGTMQQRRQFLLL